MIPKHLPQTALPIVAVLTLTPVLWAQDDNAAEPKPDPKVTPAEQAAEPAWQICNETSFALRIATATSVEGNVQPRGWDNLHAGSCLSVDAPPDTPRFVYAESSPVHRGGIREWKGEVQLCASDKDFIADSAIGCALQNLTSRNYIAVDPAEAVTTFMEIEDFGSKARTAGIQRLLKDNGYPITRIDGVEGRRTSKTLAKFIKDQGLTASMTGEDELAALEAAALEKSKTVGLTVCNKSSANIWTAIGRRRKGNWESRGWWSIEPEKCGQVFTESLISSDLAYYAIQDGIIEETGAQGPDRKLRSQAAKPSQFCVAESRFSVMGRDSCSDQGYRAANFRNLPIDKDGITIDLTDADFAEPSPSGLRK